MSASSMSFSQFQRFVRDASDEEIHHEMRLLKSEISEIQRRNERTPTLDEFNRRLKVMRSTISFA